MEKHRNCYSCGKTGHFSNDCPQKTSLFNNNKKRKGLISSSLSAIITSTTSHFPRTHCPCGGGLCVIKFTPIKHKPFYSCPNKYEMHCGYFKLCDKLKQHEILDDRPPPYPTCSCGAGVCRLEKVTQGPNAGRKYFACRIQKGQGACNFWRWQDDSTAYDYDIANEIDMIRKEFENGEIDPDFPCSEDEININASDETFLQDNKTQLRPFSSPCGPIDAEALLSMDSEDEGWWW